MRSLRLVRDVAASLRVTRPLTADERAIIDRLVREALASNKAKRDLTNLKRNGVKRDLIKSKVKPKEM